MRIISIAFAFTALAAVTMAAEPKIYKYALLVGRDVYKLSDQETPAKFAGKTVAVSGTLYTKTNILKVEKIESRVK